MDLIGGDLKKLYLKFLCESFGSVFISSIYGLVDMAMVGRYHGPDGSEAMAVTETLAAAYVIFSLIKENRKPRDERDFFMNKNSISGKTVRKGGLSSYEK